jgi:imidazolonepropionase-like amidohydrolase
MRRLLALLVIAVLLSACAAPGAPQPAVGGPQPTIQPSVTPAAAAIAIPLASPTAAPTQTPAPPPSPTAAPPPAATAPPPAALPRYDLVLIGGTLLDATGAPPLPDAAVAILDGRIAFAGPAAELAYSADTPVRNAAGATILPGFVNAHAHISGLSADDLRRWPRAGVTTVRDLAGPLDERISLREQLRAGGDPTLPRLLVSGPIVTVAGGYPFAVSDSRLRVAAQAVSGPVDAAAQVGALADAGVDLVKISVSGRTDVSWPELSDAEIAAITEAARARGLRVSAHVDRSAALRRAVLGGITDAAHSPRDRVPDEVFRLMVERGVTMTPTIAVYEALALSRGKAVDWRRLTQPVLYDNLRRFVAAGGTLALGDDYGGVPGMPVGMPMDEIRHWLAAGLTPQQIIEAATRGSATSAGLADQLGTVEAGKRADLLVVWGDPLADISALGRPALVLRGGQIVGP